MKHNKDVCTFYKSALAERGYQADDPQLAAVARLQQFYDEWVVYKSRRSGKLSKLIIRPDVPRGIYLWGGVGRGKSFLMDGFYSVVPVVRKTRIHFHEFMRGVHRERAALYGVVDPLDAVAKRIAAKYRLVCFDEFHVSDIADAMILSGLFTALFANNVAFVMTSNYAPDALYPDGMHRDRLLPMIELFKTKLDILNVDAGIDYRTRVLRQVESYHSSLNEKSAQALERAFTAIAETTDEDRVVSIEDRELKTVRRAGGVIWFDFETLCCGPRSQLDYLEIAKRFHTVILSSMPEMPASMESAARRFTWLVDVLYDHKVKLIVSAAVEPARLYTKEGVLSLEFQRTVSRLSEMQTAAYMEAERCDVVDAIC